MRKLWRLTVSILMVFLTVLSIFYICLDTHADAPQSLGSVRVNVKTYLAGRNQLTHPSVVVFPEAWNGARFWMAYSPYPNGNGEEENPCLAISDDMLYWECPPGLANPIADNEEMGCDELKDPHLLYRDDLDRLEMWYLGRLSEELGGDGTSLLLLRKFSQDGIHWTDYEIMSSTEYLSPTVFWDGTKYQMWSIGYALWGTTGTVVYQESPDGVNWTEPVRCTVGNRESDIDIWHGAVTFHDGNYHFVFIDNSDKQEIFYCSSPDGIHFSEPDVIVENNGYWNYLYRPALVYSDDTVSCLYGVINQEKQWYISMSTGEDVHHLAGVNEAHTDEMYPLQDTAADTHSIRYRVKKLYQAVRTSLLPELAGLAVLEAALLFLIRHLRNGKKYIALFTCVNWPLSMGYLFIRLHPAAFVSWLGCFWAACSLNIGMWAVLNCVYVYINEEKCREN